MTQGQGWARACLMGLWFALASSAVWAQSAVTPEQEYKDLIRVSEDIQPLGEHPFGANISLYDGSLSFEQTDVSLAGNGPLLELTRSFTLRGRDNGYLGRSVPWAFGDWELDLPRIATMTANQTNVAGWQVRSGGNNQRCSDFGPPPIVAGPDTDAGRADWPPDKWWQGYHLVLPGQGSQDLLQNAGSNAGTYPIVTKNHWRISCIVETTTANGQPGDGFIAQAPDGTRYWFNELTYRWAPTLERAIDGGPLGDRRAPLTNPSSLWAERRAVLAQLLGWLTGSAPAQALPVNDLLRRREGWMLVTRIEDRFGNTLIYSYTAGGQLTGICDSSDGVQCASDGRKLTVQYVAGSARIHSVTLQPASGNPRTWTYQYAGDTEARMELLSVTLPDGRQWQFDLDEFDSDATLHSEGGGDCSTVSEPDWLGTTWTGSITHPSGLTGSFSVTPRKHGRAYTPKACWAGPGILPENGYALRPKAWYSFTITQKTFSGAGVPPATTWHYTYSDPHDSWTTECASGCVASVWTKVLNPDGSSVKYTFSNLYDVTESQLQETSFYDAGGTRLRLETNAYADPDSGPWPLRAGYNLQNRINVEQAEQVSPLDERVLTQDGTTYTWQAEAFNAYAQVVRTRRFNDITGQTSVEESTTYLNDTTHWVLGLPLETKNLTTGVTVSKNVYDNTNDTLSARYRFGQKVMDYTFNAAGQLASFTDGNDHTTTFGSYKRGIPRTIGYPDGTSQSLSVDDFGQIAAITDQAGHTTSYSYDAVGRLTQIAYPSDSVAWYPRTFAYSYVTGAEHGLDGGHWQRTVSQGNARHVTWFDALLRPVLSDTYINGDSSSHVSTRTAYNWKGLATFQAWPFPGSLDVSDAADGTSTTYDALGRVIAVSHPSELGTLTTTTTYLSGARKQITDAGGNVTTTSYQVFDQPDYDAVIKVQAPEGVTQSITRDLYGSPTKIVQSGAYGGGTDSLVKYYFYDPYHRLCRTQEPETGSTLTGYDSANNPVWSAEGVTGLGPDSGCGSVDASSRTTRSYDAMNRLTEVSHPDGFSHTKFTYDALGHIATAAALSDGATWTYIRNARGLLTSETLDIDGYHWPIGYTYDRYGSVASTIYPDGKPVAYAPDALGRPTRAGIYAVGASYLADGSIEHFTYISGAEYLAQQNRRHLLHNLAYGTPGTLTFSQDMTYDADANLKTVTDLVDATRNKAMTYDGLNRLMTATGQWGSASYGYDALNNIRHLDDRIYDYEAATNHLTAIKSGSTVLHSFGYDTAGNTKRKDSATRVFDQARRLRQIGAYSYAYDASGRRIRKTHANDNSTYYAYSSAGRLLWQYVPATPTTGIGTDYVYLGTKMVARLARDVSSQAPAAPASLTVPATSNGSLEVAWSEVMYAGSYRLQQQKNGGSWTKVYDGAMTARTLDPGTGIYVYRVAACNQAGCSPWTTGGTAVVTVPPGTAPDLADPGTTDVDGSYPVSWSAVDDASAYTLQEHADGGSWSTVQDDASLSMAISGKTDGTYTYRVRARNAGGYGPWSASQSIVVLLPPATPATISVPSTSSGSFAVSWAASSTANSYILYQSVDGAGYTTVSSDSSRSRTVSVSSSGSYRYAVKACNASGCSGYRYSGYMTVTIPPDSAPSLTVPTDSDTGSYTVSWGSVSDATRYVLEEQKNSGSWTDSYSGGSRSKAYSGKTNGADYHYRVSACNAGGCGPPSVTRKIHIAIPPPKPTGVYANDKVISGKIENVTVVWQAVSGASRYQIRNAGGAVIYDDTATSVLVETGNYPLDPWAYAVQACNPYACSAWVNATPRDTTPPATVPSLSVPSVDANGSYTVSWGSVSGADSYTLQQQVNGGSWSTQYSGSGHSKAYSGKSDGTYGYRVRGCNGTYCGSWSATHAVTVVHPPSAAPSLSLSVSGPDYKPVVRATWSSEARATEYVVELSPAVNGSTQFYDGPNTTASSLMLADGQIGFHVKACNAGGCSGWSAWKYVTLHSGLGGLGVQDAPTDAEPSAVDATAEDPATPSPTDPGDQP